MRKKRTPKEKVDLTPAPLVLAKEQAIAKRRKARAVKAQLLQGMGLVNLQSSSAFAPYYQAGQAWLEAAAGIYAGMCGGRLGPGPMALLGNAAICLAMARYLADQGFTKSDPSITRMSLKYMDAMRQQSLAAYELGAREAHMRKEHTDTVGLDAFEAALKAQNGT